MLPNVDLEVIFGQEMVSDQIFDASLIICISFSLYFVQLTEPNEENEINVIPESFLPAIRHLSTLVNFQFVSLLYSGPYVKSVDVESDSQDQRNGVESGNVEKLKLTTLLYEQRYRFVIFGS